MGRIFDDPTCIVICIMLLKRGWLGMERRLEDQAILLPMGLYPTDVNRPILVFYTKIISRLFLSVSEPSSCFPVSTLH